MTDRAVFLRKMGRRIREARNKQGLTAAKVADRADMEASFLSKLENGLVWVGPEALNHLARALGVPPGELVPSDTPLNATELGVRRVPLLNRVPAGSWQEIVEGRSEDDVCEYVRLMRDAGPRAFAITVRGDSMRPIYSEGDVLIVDPDAPLKPACFVVAQNDSSEWTFKQYKVDHIDAEGREVFKLVPLNDAYPTIHSDNARNARIRIVGPVVQHIRFPY